MDRILSYGLVGCMGVSAATISAAIVGNPIPVVTPAVVAGAAIAGHHVRQQGNSGADDQDVRASVEQVETDGGRQQ